MTGLIGYLLNRTLKFSLLFMVEERKLDPLKLMVSVKSSTQSLNFMASTGIVIQTSFLMKTLFTRLLKTKMETPCQSRIFDPEIINVYNTCSMMATM